MSIDPIVLARFMVLPGAAELIEAFSALPPGELRESAISHVQVLARHAGGWDASAAGEPIGGIVAHVGAPQPAFPAPAPPAIAHGRAVSTSVRGRIVERLLQGETERAIADDEGVTPNLVHRVKEKARREGGLVFPGDTKEKPRRREPVPRDLWWQDPDSPIWDDPDLLPTVADGGAGTPAGLGPLTRQAFRQAEHAARRRGMSLREHLAKKAEAVARVDAGESPSDLIRSGFMAEWELYALLARVGKSAFATLATPRGKQAARA